MDIQTVSPLPRRDLASFLPTPRAIKAFEDVQLDTANIGDALSTAQFLTISDSPALGAERILTPTAGELTGDDDGAGASYRLGLADTAILAGDYGDESHLVKIVFDQKGRATAATAYELNSDNVTEGSTNLFFTINRARASVSSGAGLDYDEPTGVFTVSPAGTYGLPTGTLSRASFAAYSAPTVSNPPTQAEVQGIANALQAHSQVLAALITDLRANGNLS